MAVIWTETDWSKRIDWTRAGIDNIVSKKKIKKAVSLAIQRQQIVIRKLTSVRALGVMAEIFLVKMHYKKKIEWSN